MRSPDFHSTRCIVEKDGTVICQPKESIKVADGSDSNSDSDSE